MSTPVATVGDVCAMFGGGTPARDVPAYYGGSIPWVTPKDMKVWEITGAEVNITESGLANSAARLAPAGSVLVVVRSGVLKHTLPVAIARTAVAINQDMKALVCSDRVLPEYLARYLKEQSGTILKWVRATTADNFQPDRLRALPIPLPPLVEQRRIAAILDKADELRAKRRAAIAKLDTLTQSIFLDMFGDPATNPKGWPVERLGKCTAQIQIGPFGSLLHQKDYVQGGIPLVNPKHIQNGEIRPGSEESVSPRKFKELKTYHLRRGDVVMGRRGEMGRCAVVNEVYGPLLCGTGSLFVRPDVARTTSMFLYFLLSSAALKARLERLSLGQTLPNLNSRIVEGLQVPLPPLAMQNEFAITVAGARALAGVQSTSACTLDHLFATLQSRAFNGRL